jgi:serine/threonine protein kinase
MSTRFGRFHLLGLLGRGALGDTYKAHDERSGRTLALKVVDLTFGREAALWEVAATLTTLSHPHLAELLEATHVDGRAVLAFELVEGQPLDALLSGHTLAARRAVDIGLAVAGALSVAHRRGIVHGDLRPANIMVSRNGRPKLIDTGLAAFTRGGAARLRLGAAPDQATDLPRGLPEYLAPEQALGEAGDARTDVFCLGAALYEMLAGRPPHTGATPADAIVHLLSSPPVPLSRLRRDLPPTLDALVLSCLAKSVASRPADGGAVARRLADVAEALRGPAS